MFLNPKPHSTIPSPSQLSNIITYISPSPFHNFYHSIHSLHNVFFLFIFYHHSTILDYFILCLSLFHHIAVTHNILLAIPQNSHHNSKYISTKHNILFTTSPYRHHSSKMSLPSFHSIVNTPSIFIIPAEFPSHFTMSLSHTIYHSSFDSIPTTIPQCLYIPHSPFHKIPIAIPITSP